MAEHWPSTAVLSALQLQERRAVEEFSVSAKALARHFFFSGGCEAPLKSASAASG